MPDNTALEILSLPPNATVEDVKLAYKKLSHIMHPDKGGDIEEFKHLQKVYQRALDEAREHKIELLICKRCDGSGRVQVTRGASTMSKMCPACQGSGNLED